MNKRTHFFRKIYLSHFIFERFAKGLILVMCERWVRDGTDCNILTPTSSDYSSTFSSFCWAAQPGSRGPKPSVWSWFSLPRTATRTPTDSQTTVAPGYIIVWRPPASCGRRNCTDFNPSTGQGDTSLSSIGCTCFLIDGWVEGQYVTLITVFNASQLIFALS